MLKHLLLVLVIVSLATCERKKKNKIRAAKTTRDIEELQIFTRKELRNNHLEDDMEKQVEVDAEESSGKKSAHKVAKEKPENKVARDEKKALKAENKAAKADKKSEKTAKKAEKAVNMAARRAHKAARKSKKAVKAVKRAEKEVKKLEKVAKKAEKNAAKKAEKAENVQENSN